MKTCTGCDRSLPLEKFSPKGSGHQSRCKTCRAADARKRISVKSAPATYRPDSPNSFFHDLARQGRESGANERLARHAAETAEQRDVTSATGGFIPPVWLEDDYALVARSPRPLADRVAKFSLGGYGEVFSYPKASAGATVAVQATENAAVSETNFASSNVSANLVTITGQNDVSMQILRRSAPGIDAVLFEDLMRAYNAKLESQLLYGAGSGSGEHVGIDGLASSIAVTASTATQVGVFASIAQGISQLATQRMVNSDIVVLLHPRRASWLSAASGTASLSDNPAFNDLGFEVEFVTDPSISTVKGAGTNEDRVMIVHAPSLRLGEDVLQLDAKALPLAGEDVLSGTLTVRLTLRGYSVFIPDRYPAASATLSGVGLVAVAGY